MQKKIHVELIHLGRASYHHRIAHAKNNPEEAMSVVIDGADQAAYGIPHFPEKCKDTDKGHKLRHKVYGVKVHGNWTAFYVYGGHLEGKRREERSST